MFIFSLKGLVSIEFGLNFNFSENHAEIEIFKKNCAIRIETNMKDDVALLKTLLSDLEAELKLKGKLTKT